ncbi:protein SNORC isoform X2 [Parus major]|uniref:protein SNORC isoform X2 n=1 Tax=Parus major TaxID=9157 RepID=UPI000771346A|nr:protein SNORC isoform X2 [Parus major]
MLLPSLFLGYREPGTSLKCLWYTKVHTPELGCLGHLCALPQGTRVLAPAFDSLFPSPDNHCVSSEYPQDPVPTLWNEPPELPSGAGPFDAATNPARLSDATAFPPYTSELEPEDTTQLHRLDAGDGSLGPGAIGAIVIASLLGTSVLVALVIITLRKFSAS